MNCVSCERLLNCSDSPLSIAGNALGIVTFLYAILIGSFIFAMQLRNSSSEVKRFAKSVAFLHQQIRHNLQEFSKSTENNQGSIANDQHIDGTPVPGGLTVQIIGDLLSNDEDKEKVAALKLRVNTFLNNFPRLLNIARTLASAYLSQDAEKQHQERKWSVPIQGKIRWIWTRGENMEILTDMENEFASILSQAERESVCLYLHFY
jgi:hypothetical protein